MTNLPAFSGYNGSCPKCGNVGDVTVEYVPENTLDRRPRPPERLRRQCPGCTYQWYELCLDASSNT